MNFQSIEKIFHSFNDLTVLIVGDVMLDSYVYGQAERISPEAPVPVVNVSKKEQRLGGAANVALNLQALGAKPLLCSVIGDDAQGTKIYELLKKRGISDEGMIKSKNRITTVKERVLSGSQQLLRIDQETDQEIDAAEERKLVEKISQFIGQSDVIIFEDYDKGSINSTLIAETIKLAKAQNIPTVVDPKKRNFFSYQGASLFKPNLKELKEGLKIEIALDDQNQIHEAVEKLRSKTNIGAVMITLSEKGIYIANAQEKHLLPAHLRMVSDVSGAGDTVISIAALGMALKLSLRLVADLANLGGGIVCEYLGVVPIKKEQLLQEAIQHQLLSNT